LDEEELDDIDEIDDIPEEEEEKLFDESLQDSRAPVIQEQSLPNLKNPTPSDGKVSLYRSSF